VSVAVVGAGAWGTSLAKLLSEKGEAVALWCREPEVAASIRSHRVNERFLPDALLPASLEATTELGSAVEGRELIVLAVPSQYLRPIIAAIASHVDRNQRFVSATKGIEETTLLTMSAVVDDVLPFSPDVTVISGPTFAKEVSAGEPTAIVAASLTEGSAVAVQTQLATRAFRVYTNDDVVGVELGGALKNIIALAVGVAAGLGFGHNPKAALMARGLKEIERLAEAMGGQGSTLSGLAGVGDLVLTCTGELSRNRTVGVGLGRGESLEDILSAMPQIAEGVSTTHAAAALARRHGVDMPITLHMERLLTGKTTAQRAVEDLLARPLGAE
jgi:glycerol-3-phosphate dehydrogenase (NAD(P)+)